MARYLILLLFCLSPAVLVGCGGKGELKPDAGEGVEEVDPAEIQKQIQEGMKKGGVKQPMGK